MPPTTSSTAATVLRARLCMRSSHRHPRIAPRFSGISARVARHATIAAVHSAARSRPMEYRPLGHTGIRVTELCLGAMTFGREASESDSRAILDRFLEAGGNFVDTANVYAGGASEEILGRVFSERPGVRDAIVLATKVRLPTGDGVNDSGASRRNIRASVERSLRRLQTDWI